VRVQRVKGRTMVKSTERAAKRGLLRWVVLLLVATVLVVSSAASCGRKGVTSEDVISEGVISKEVEAIFGEGIFVPTDLSLSPLDEMALPTIEVEVPPLELPDLDMDIGVDMSSVTGR